MRFPILFLLAIFSVKHVSSQVNLSLFEKDFTALASSGFQWQLRDSLVNKYGRGLLYLPLGPALSADVPHHPLSAFKKTRTYKKNIPRLLKDSVWGLNGLGCLVAAVADDKRQIPLLEKILQRDRYQNSVVISCLFWLKSKNTQPFVRSIAAGRYEFYNDFLRLDSHFVRKFGRDSVFSANKYIQEVAFRALLLNPFDSIQEIILRKLVRESNLLRGQALNVLGSHHASNIYPLIAPYQKDGQWTGLNALLNSPDPADNRALDAMIRKGPRNSQLIDGLGISNKISHIKRWFSLIRNDSLSGNFDAFLNRKVLGEDIWETEIKSIIINRLDDKRIAPLFQYFSTRTEDSVTLFLLKCLSHPALSIENQRPIVANLTGRNRTLIAQSMPELMAKATEKDFMLLYVLIPYNLRGYEDKVRLWMSSATLDEYIIRSCKKYLSPIKYPVEDHVRLYGRVNNYQKIRSSSGKDSIRVTLYEPYLHTSAVKVDSVGNFNLSFYKGFTGEIDISYNNKSATQMLAYPGDYQNVTMDIHGDSIVLSQFGYGNQDANQVISMYLKARSDIWKNKQKTQLLSEIEYKRRKSFLEKYIAGNHLPTMFVQWAWADLNYEYATSVLQGNMISDSTFFKQFPTDAPRNLVSSNYIRYLQAVHANDLHQHQTFIPELQDTSHTVDKIALDYIRTKTSGVIKDFLFANYISSVISMTSGASPNASRYHYLSTIYKKEIPYGNYGEFIHLNSRINK